jgi:hypothetical protein
MRVVVGHACMLQHRVAAPPAALPPASPAPQLTPDATTHTPATSCRLKWTGASLVSSSSHPISSAQWSRRSTSWGSTGPALTVSTMRHPKCTHSWPARPQSSHPLLPALTPNHALICVHTCITRLTPPPNRVACRLTSLPSDVQSTIYRKAGRHTRQVAPLWNDAYGPLDCGIRLDHVRNKADMEDLLARDPSRFSDVTALCFRTELPLGSAPDNLHPADVISALPSAFPKLQALDVRSYNGGSVSAAGLRSLSTLSSCLTCLALPAVAPFLPAVAQLALLTSLRSLSFDWHNDNAGSPDLVQGMLALSGLPHLQLLQYPSQPSICSCPAADLLPVLRRMDLTDLGLNLYLHSWDLDSVEALRTALPQLSALTLLLDFFGTFGNYGPDPASTHAVVAALAQRTALRSLTLDVSDIFHEHHNLASLSALQLARLDVKADAEGGPCTGKLEVLLAAMAVNSTLTSFAFNEGMPVFADLSQAALHSLAALAPGLRSFTLSAVLMDDAALLDVVGTMTRLTALHLEGGLVHIERKHAVEQLSRLTALQVLEICTRGFRLTQAAVQAINALPNLRDLSVGCCDAPQEVEDKLVDASCMWSLVSKQHTLTRLALSSAGLTGPALGSIVGRMTALQHLELKHMAVITCPLLHKHLLPLPPALRMLRFRSRCLVPEVSAALQAAAQQQGCAFIVAQDE